MRTTRRSVLASLAAGSAGLALPIARWCPARAAETMTGVTYLPPSYKGLMWA